MCHFYRNRVAASELSHAKQQQTRIYLEYSTRLHFIADVRWPRPPNSNSCETYVLLEATHPEMRTNVSHRAEYLRRSGRNTTEWCSCVANAVVILGTIFVWLAAFRNSF